MNWHLFCFFLPTLASFSFIFATTKLWSDSASATRYLWHPSLISGTYCRPEHCITNWSLDTILWQEIFLFTLCFAFSNCGPSTRLLSRFALQTCTCDLMNVFCTSLLLVAQKSLNIVSQSSWLNSLHDAALGLQQVCLAQSLPPPTTPTTAAFHGFSRTFQSPNNNEITSTENTQIHVISPLFTIVWQY